MSTTNPHIPYPSPIRNLSFSDILCRKYEFCRFFLPKADVTREPKNTSKNNQTQGQREFELKPYQRMLAAFMSPKTPYSGLLLFHATGTGKTCTAITITRQFSINFSKPPLVIFPSTLLENNFQKEVKWCGTKTSSAEDALGWEFRGAIEFANIVKRIEDEAGQDKVLLQEMLREAFSNRVLVVDEAHNLRSNDADKKQVPPKLKLVLRAAQNIKLILLTATPMFDNAREIVFLLNLLLANDNRAEIRETDIFDSYDTIKPNAANALAEASRGYISFQLVGNDRTFPERLDPPRKLSLYDGKKTPQLDIYNNPIEPPERLAEERLKGIVSSCMCGTQREVYTTLVKYVSTNRNAETQDVSAFGSEADAAPTNNVFTRLRMATNIVFPSPGIDVSATKNAFKYVTGIGGFNRCLQHTQDGKIAYRANVPEFLGPDLISKHACKVDTIVKCIQKCEGVVLVHSAFIVCGLLPIALALEHIGYQRYGGNNLLKRNHTKDKAKPKLHSYVLWTGQTKYSPNKDEEIEIAKEPTNANGGIIKVILASDVATEGIDLKCIRQVHILDPWYNHSKMKQVFGRAIRHNSHAALPQSMRNVTIYQHAAIEDGATKESIDLRTYRIAYNKQRKIDATTNVLRASAIDERFNIAKFIKSIGGGSDRSTFDVFFAKADIENTVSKIRECFEEAIVLTYEQLLQSCRPIDEEVFIWSLQSVVDDPSPDVVYSNIAGTKGKIVYVSNKYVFQPSYSTDPRLTLAVREGLSVSNHLSRVETSGDASSKNGAKRTNRMSTVVSSMAEVVAQATGIIAELGCDPDDYMSAAIDSVLDRLSSKEHMALLTSHPTDANLRNLPHVAHDPNTQLPMYMIDFQAPKASERYLKWRQSKLGYEPSALDERTIKGIERDIQNTVVARMDGVQSFITSDSNHRIFKMISSFRHHTGGLLTGTSCLTTSTIKKRDVHKLIKDLDHQAVGKLDPTKSAKGDYCNMYELVLRSKAPQLLLRPYEHHLVLLAQSRKTAAKPLKR
jgi:superfamily II DNA or RNA helicase